jgi:hypothetical protein
MPAMVGRRRKLDHLSRYSSVTFFVTHPLLSYVAGSSVQLWQRNENSQQRDWTMSFNVKKSERWSDSYRRGGPCSWHRICFLRITSWNWSTFMAGLSLILRMLTEIRCNCKGHERIYRILCWKEYLPVKSYLPFYYRFHLPRQFIIILESWNVWSSAMLWLVEELINVFYSQRMSHFLIFKQPLYVVNMKC